MGQKLPLCAQLGAMRSLQDESKEGGEVGSKRTSSRCNAVHHVCWGGLISRLLTAKLRPPGHRIRAARLPDEPQYGENKQRKKKAVV
jgi:hypothetical protein